MSSINNTLIAKPKPPDAISREDIFQDAILDTMGVTQWVRRRQIRSIDDDTCSQMSIELLSDPPQHPIVILTGIAAQTQRQRAPIRHLLANILQTCFQIQKAPLVEAVTHTHVAEAVPLAEQFDTLSPLACLVFGDCLPDFSYPSCPIIRLPSLEQCLADPSQKALVWEILCPWVRRWRVYHPQWSQ